MNIDMINATLNELYGVQGYLQDRVLDLEMQLDIFIEKKQENICKHENIVNGAYPRSNPPLKCKKCGVMYYE